METGESGRTFQVSAAGGRRPFPLQSKIVEALFPSFLFTLQYLLAPNPTFPAPNEPTPFSLHLGRVLSTTSDARSFLSSVSSPFLPLPLNQCDPVLYYALSRRVSDGHAGDARLRNRFGGDDFLFPDGTKKMTIKSCFTCTIIAKDDFCLRQSDKFSSILCTEVRKEGKE